MPVVARALEARAAEKGGLDKLGERKDLEPELVAAVTSIMAPRLFVEKDRKISIPHWSPIGRVDVVCRRHPGEMPVLAAELKWSVGEKIYEGIWDLFKMALLAQHPSVGATYLITGASEKEWASGVGKDIFTEGTQTVVGLCALQFPNGRYAWDYALEGGKDYCPLIVPATIRTHLVACEQLAGGPTAWQLRAIRVEPVGDEVVPFVGGWPKGDRPPGARRPLLP